MYVGIPAASTFFTTNATSCGETFKFWNTLRVSIYTKPSKAAV